MVYKEPARCPWSTTDPLYIKYHDEEWGVPVHHDKKLFEFIMLEGAQGLDGSAAHMFNSDKVYVW